DLLQAGNAETALLITHQVVTEVHDLRVDERERLDLLITRIDDDDTVRDTDLRRREADAFLGVHGVEHVADERAHLIRDLLHRRRLLAEHRIAHETQLPDCHVSRSAPWG